MDLCRHVNVEVNGVKIRHQPDSASDVNLWAQNHFDDFCSKVGGMPKLAKATKPLCAANGTIIQVKGYFIATLTSKSASRIARIFVWPDYDTDLPLLCKFDLYHLGYLHIDPDGAFETKRVSNLDTDTDFSEDIFKELVNKLHQRYEQVFKGVGQYKHHTVDLEVKPGSQPFVLRAIPCPIHLRKPALERLEYFIKLGILKPLPVGYPIRYCSPMLVVQKPNKPGEVRLVVNCKRLNLQLSRTRQVPAIGLRDFCRVTQGFKFWFRLDLKDAYHQLRLSKRAKDLTIVSTFAGVFSWEGLPQGLICAGDIFDQVMESVLID